MGPRRALTAASLASFIAIVATAMPVVAQHRAVPRPVAPAPFTAGAVGPVGPGVVGVPGPYPVGPYGYGHTHVTVGVGFSTGFYPWGWGGFGFGVYFGQHYDPWFYGYPGSPYYFGVPYAYYGPVYGKMKVNVTPATALVYVDGYFAGTAKDLGGSFHDLHLEPGAHTVEIKADGYEPQRLNVRATPDQTIRYTGELKRY